MFLHYLHKYYQCYLNPTDFSNQLFNLEVTDVSKTLCFPTSQLFSDVCPKTSKNFEALCTGEQGLSQSGLRLCYKGSLFHRVVSNGWVQGGGTIEPIFLRFSSGTFKLDRTFKNIAWHPTLPCREFDVPVMIFA